MKKFVIFSLFSFFALLSAHAQTRFGVKTGLSLATVSGSSDLGDFYEENWTGESFNPLMIPSFYVGGQVDIDFQENLGLGVGLVLIGKGFKLNESGAYDGDRYTYDEKTSNYYLQIPVNLLYKNSGFFGAFGPYVGIGLGGKYKNEFEVGSYREKNNGKIEFTNEWDVDDDGDEIFLLTKKMRPIEFGVGLELGYSFENLRLTAAYNLGLTNIYPKDLVSWGDDIYNIDNMKATNRVITIGAAYMF